MNKLVAAMESVKVGAPTDDGVDICGLVSSMQFDKVKGMVDRAVAGRRQGRVRRRSHTNVGYGFQPTVLNWCQAERRDYPGGDLRARPCPF